MYYNKWFVGSLRTLKSSKLKLLIVRFFGKRITGVDSDGVTLVGYVYKDELYFWDVENDSTKMVI